MEKNEILKLTGHLVGFNSIFVPNTKFDKNGDYCAKIRVDASVAEPLIEKLKELRKQKRDDYKAETKKNLKFTDNGFPIVLYSEEQTEDSEGNVTNIPHESGDYVITAHKKAYFKSKKGNVFPDPLIVIDGQGKPVDDCPLGTGSLISIQVEINPWVVEAQGVGINLKLQGVQILQVVNFKTTQLTFDVVEDAFSVNDIQKIDDSPTDTLPDADKEDDTQDGQGKPAF